MKGVIESVLAQDYAPLELIISDNASTDGTEALCRDAAAADSRIIYHRQPTNVGILNNFIQAMQLARGTYFRWLGDDDWLAPTYVSRCVEEFSSDSSLVLVTTQLNHVRQDGSTHTVVHSDTTFRSADPIERFDKLLSYLVDGFLPFDPLYGLFRRTSLLGIKRRNVIREDEVFAAKMALVGPWGHVSEILTRQSIRVRGHGLARYLSVPSWQAHIPTAVQCWELLGHLRTEGVVPAQRNRARVVLGRYFVKQHMRTLRRRSMKLRNLIFRRGPVSDEKFG